MDAGGHGWPPAPKLAYTIPEVCEQTTLSRAEVYKRIAAGQIVARKLGRRTVVTHDDLAKFIDNLPHMAALG